MTDFTHAGYRGLLRMIRGLGRAAVSFRDIPADCGYVILRHDIDFSLRKAVEFAYIDREESATSTFFVLLTAPYYNPLSEEGVRAIRTIVELGHECGLHYDATGFELLTPAQRERRIEVLARTLEDVAGTPVRAIAQHKPAGAAIRQEFPGFVDAYSAPYFKDIPYISDSRRMFRVADVRAFLRQNFRCQALLHPIWWWPEPMSRSDIFTALEAETAMKLSTLMEAEQQSIERGVVTLAAL